MIERARIDTIIFIIIWSIWASARWRRSKQIFIAKSTSCCWDAVITLRWAWNAGIVFICKCWSRTLINTCFLIEKVSRWTFYAWNFILICAFITICITRALLMASWLIFYPICSWVVIKWLSQNAIKLALIRIWNPTKSRYTFRALCFRTLFKAVRNIACSS